MNSRERIAYLRGLLDSAPREDREGKLFAAITEALDALASELSEHGRLIELQSGNYDELMEEFDELREDVYDLEQYVGPDSDEEEDEDSYIATTCPSCAYCFYYKLEDGDENEKLVCPKCGEEFERSPV
ncbi:MAG: hypothetical protein LBR38_05920 [Synergistaceae bacterium]|jgi:Rad3-related DNA helicase|nr:hypothetical protein [Synergistaceae bacterium]